MEKNILMKIIFSFVIIVCFVTMANAQHGYTVDKQVKFAAGKTAVSYKSRLPNRLETHTYHLKAEAGKILYVQLVSKNPEMTFQIFDAGDNEIGSAGDEQWFWEGELNSSGEYTILVLANRGAGNYTLNIRLK
jgi:hypothetical protein